MGKSWAPGRVRGADPREEALRTSPSAPGSSRNHCSIPARRRKYRRFQLATCKLPMIDVRFLPLTGIFIRYPFMIT
jgi:hypothetical protein